MSLEINGGVFDNDVKGGQSTGYWLSIKPDKKSKLPPVYLHYRLFDLLDGWFHPEDVCAKYRAEQKEIDKQAPIKEVPKIEKKELTDPFILSYINFVIDQNHNVVQDYKKGKTASLNFLVGCVMKKNSQHDPEVIKNAFKKILDLD